MGVLIAASSVAVLTTVGIILSLVVESFQFFQMIPFTDFVFGIHWSPQIAIREDQVGASGAFGAIPLLGDLFDLGFKANRAECFRSGRSDGRRLSR